MKKLIKMMGLLTIVAVLFAGCKDPNSTASDPYADCSKTITADEIELSAGNWTMKAVMTVDLSYTTTTQIIDLKATVAEDGNYTFTSGKMTMSTDLSSMGITQAMLDQLTDADKEALIESMTGSLPEDAEFSFNGTVITVTRSIPENELSYYISYFDLADLPSDATIKANGDKTKYVLSYTEESTSTDNEGNTTTVTETYTYYISKD